MSPTQGRAWIALMATARLLPARLDTQLTAQVGLSHFEYTILSVLQSTKNKTLRMGNLAAPLACPAPKLSKAVTRLEKRGLVARTHCESDRRAINVTVTSAGRRLWLKATPSLIALARDTVLAEFTDEDLDTLAALLGYILNRLDPDQTLCSIVDHEEKECDQWFARELAADGMPVAVTCRVLEIDRQP